MPGPLKDGVYERLVDEALAALAEEARREREVDIADLDLGRTPSFAAAQVPMLEALRVWLPTSGGAGGHGLMGSFLALPLAASLGCAAQMTMPVFVGQDPPAAHETSSHEPKPGEASNDGTAGADTPGGELPIILVRCILSVEGRLGDCRVLRSDAPDMDRAVLESIQRRRYKPALRDGIPVEVRFNFKIKLRRPP